MTLQKQLLHVFTKQFPYAKFMLACQAYKHVFAQMPIAIDNRLNNYLRWGFSRLVDLC